MRRPLTITLALLSLGATAVPPGPLWREAPAYVALFAPGGARAGAYTAYVTDLGFDRALAAAVADPRHLAVPGAWAPQQLLPADAFGQSGRYDRWALARLYGAVRARVARGPVGDRGRPVEAWTLVSPYPDPTLRRLRPGTLLIVLSLDRP